MIEWLLDVEPGTPGKPDDWRKRGFMTDPEHDLRTHLGMDNESGSGKEGMLFQTAGFQFRDDVRLAVRVEGTLGQKIGGIHPMGGERRLAAWINGGESSAWICPAEIAEEMRTGEYPRMILATPALFDDGWKPGWLDENLIGRIPGSECLVQLVSVCIDGWKPISGWSLEIGNSGEKPIRRIVPAGGVYFFRRIGSGEFPIEQLWLQPVSDCPQWRRDGFGLALWGKWTPTERGEERQ
jgi:CRISPR-associated protein Cmr3